MKTTFSISISIPKINSQSTWPSQLHFFGINFTISKYRFTIIFKVVCVVKTKLFLYWLILIWFDNTNEVMQNNIEKYRKSFIAFEKPSILSENFENIDLPMSTKGFARFFFISFRSWFICKNWKRPGFYSFVFYNFINNSISK